jgi:molecular chaperone GrpE
MLSGHEIEDILERFRDWLAETDEAVEQPHIADSEAAMLGGAHAPRAVPHSLGYVQLVEALTALRQDVKLQTKSARGVEEAAVATLQGLDRAIEQLRSVPADEAAAAQRAARPLVEAIMDIDEVMAQATQAGQAARARLTVSDIPRFEDTLERHFRALPTWQRVLAGFWYPQMRATLRNHASERQHAIQGLLDGLSLVQMRLAQVLAKCQIERIDGAGQCVDAQSMKVVDLVHDTSLPNESVVDVLRPGYRWQGKVVRCAEVRAARHEGREE